MSSVDTSSLKALSENSKAVTFGTEPQPHLLERFASPFGNKTFGPVGGMGSVHIEAPEFTSLCPLTGQPDFATIIIDYVPGLWCVESKALKLYLMSFRNAGEFHEACVNRIARDLIELLDPMDLRVKGQFTPRGGIPFWPMFEYARPKPGKLGPKD